jgi:hypothetical protein
VFVEPVLSLSDLLAVHLLPLINNTSLNEFEFEEHDNELEDHDELDYEEQDNLVDFDDRMTRHCYEYYTLFTT